MLDIEDNLFFRMNKEKVASLLEDLDTNGNIVMGLPDINELSDGDSDKSDEEAEGTTVVKDLADFCFHLLLILNRMKTMKIKMMK